MYLIANIHTLPSFTNMVRTGLFLTSLNIMGNYLNVGWGGGGGGQN